MDNVEECRPYLTHLREEHREIHKIVRNIQAQFPCSDEVKGGDVTSQVLEGLTDLRATLRHHFAEEEAGGCIEEAVSRRPTLSAEASVLEGQHPALLYQLEGIIEHMRSTGPSVVSLKAIHAAFNSFAKDLLTHEATENRVLQQGFNVDMDLGD